MPTYFLKNTLHHYLTLELPKRPVCDSDDFSAFSISSSLKTDKTYKRLTFFENLFVYNETLNVSSNLSTPFLAKLGLSVNSSHQQTLSTNSEHLKLASVVLTPFFANSVVFNVPLFEVATWALSQQVASTCETIFNSYRSVALYHGALRLGVKNDTNYLLGEEQTDVRVVSPAILSIHFSPGALNRTSISPGVQRDSTSPNLQRLQQGALARRFQRGSQSPGVVHGLSPPSLSINMSGGTLRRGQSVSHSLSPVPANVPTPGIYKEFPISNDLICSPSCEDSTSPPFLPADKNTSTSTNPPAPSAALSGSAFSAYSSAGGNYIHTLLSFHSLDLTHAIPYNSISSNSNNSGGSGVGVSFEGYADDLLQMLSYSAVDSDVLDKYMAHCYVHTSFTDLIRQSVIGAMLSYLGQQHPSLRHLHNLPPSFLAPVPLPSELTFLLTVSSSAAVSTTASSASAANLQTSSKPLSPACQTAAAAASSAGGGTVAAAESFYSLLSLFSLTVPSSSPSTSPTPSSSSPSSTLSSSSLPFSSSPTPPSYACFLGVAHGCPECSLLPDLRRKRADTLAQTKPPLGTTRDPASLPLPLAIGAPPYPAVYSPVEPPHAHIHGHTHCDVPFVMFPASPTAFVVRIVSTAAYDALARGAVSIAAAGATTGELSRLLKTPPPPPSAFDVVEAPAPLQEGDDNEQKKEGEKPASGFELSKEETEGVKGLFVDATKKRADEATKAAVQRLPMLPYGHFAPVSVLVTTPTTTPAVVAAGSPLLLTPGVPVTPPTTPAGSSAPGTPLTPASSTPSPSKPSTPATPFTLETPSIPTTPSASATPSTFVTPASSVGTVPSVSELKNAYARLYLKDAHTYHSALLQPLAPCTDWIAPETEKGRKGKEGGKKKKMMKETEKEPTSYAFPRNLPVSLVYLYPREEGAFLMKTAKHFDVHQQFVASKKCEYTQRTHRLHLWENQMDEENKRRLEREKKRKEERSRKLEAQMKARRDDGRSDDEEDEEDEIDEDENEGAVDLSDSEGDRAFYARDEDASGWEGVDELDALSEKREALVERENALPPAFRHPVATVEEGTSLSPGFGTPSPPLPSRRSESPAMPMSSSGVSPAAAAAASKAFACVRQKSPARDFNNSFRSVSRSVSPPPYSPPPFSPGFTPSLVPQPLHPRLPPPSFTTTTTTTTGGSGGGVGSDVEGEYGAETSDESSPLGNNYSDMSSIDFSQASLQLHMNDVGLSSMASAPNASMNSTSPTLSNACSPMLSASLSLNFAARFVASNSNTNTSTTPQMPGPGGPKPQSAIPAHPKPTSKPKAGGQAPAPVYKPKQSSKK